MNDKTQIIIERGMELADSAYQKGAELVERAKISYRISGVKAEIKQAYSKLGLFTYEAIKSGNTVPDVRSNGVIAKIDSLLFRLGQLNRELSEIRGAKICSVCGTLNSDKAKFCSECANPMR